jgi:hypothetical protein
MCEPLYVHDAGNQRAIGIAPTRESLCFRETSGAGSRTSPINLGIA